MLLLQYKTIELPYIKRWLCLLVRKAIGFYKLQESPIHKTHPQPPQSSRTSQMQSFFFFCWSNLKYLDLLVVCVIPTLQPTQDYLNCPRHKTSSLTFLPSEPHSLIYVSLGNILVIFPVQITAMKVVENRSIANTGTNVEDNCSQRDVH